MQNIFSILILLFLFFGAFGALKFLFFPILIWYVIKLFMPHNILNNSSNNNWHDIFQKMNSNMNNFGKNHHFYEHFQQKQQQYQQKSQGDNYMSVEEARKILNVDDRAGANEIKSAYHKLMKKVHPDVGGSQYLAAKINKAKEILLND